MLHNTGTVSSVLYGAFIIFTIIAMFVAFYHIKKGDIATEKLDKMIDLFKYAIVSTALATVGLMIGNLYKERDQNIKELEYFDKYVNDVRKVGGIKERLQLTKYLSIVAPNGAIKDSWVNYYDEVKREHEEYLQLKSEELKIDTIRQPTPEQMVTLSKTKEAISHFETKLGGDVRPEEPIIYIQYCSEGKKSEALKMQQMFNTDLWKAPGIDLVEGGCDNSIRYFNDEDRDLANRANTLLGSNYTIKRINLPAPKGQVEIWIGE